MRQIRQPLNHDMDIQVAQLSGGTANPPASARRLPLSIQLGTVPREASDGMLRELVLALERWGDRLPRWLQRLSQRPSLLWNAGVGLIIGLSLLRWLLQR